MRQVMCGFCRSGILQWRDPTDSGGLPCPLMAPVGASKRPREASGAQAPKASSQPKSVAHPRQTPPDEVRQRFREVETSNQQIRSDAAGAWPGIALGSLATSAAPRASYGLARVGCCRQGFLRTAGRTETKNLAAIRLRTPHLAATVRVARGRSGGCGDGSRRPHSAARTRE